MDYYTITVTFPPFGAPYAEMFRGTGYVSGWVGCPRDVTLSALTHWAAQVTGKTLYRRLSQAGSNSDGWRTLTVTYGTEGRYDARRVMSFRSTDANVCDEMWGVWDASEGKWTRDGAGHVFQYSQSQAQSVARNLNAPRYVCGCSYIVRDDDRESHEETVCPLTAPATCPDCDGRVYSDGSCRCSDALPSNAGSAC